MHGKLTPRLFKDKREMWLQLGFRLVQGPGHIMFLVLKTAAAPPIDLTSLLVAEPSLHSQFLPIDHPYLRNSRVARLGSGVVTVVALDLKPKKGDVGPSNYYVNIPLIAGYYPSYSRMLAVEVQR